MIRPALVTTLLGLTGAAPAQVVVPAPATTTTVTTTTTMAPTAERVLRPMVTPSDRPLPPPRVAPEPAGATRVMDGYEPGAGAADRPVPPPPPPPRVTRMGMAGRPLAGCPCPVPYIVARGYAAPMNMDMDMDMVPPPPPPLPAMPVPPPPPPQLTTAYAIDPANAAVPDTVPPLPIDRGRPRIIGPRPAMAAPVLAPVPDAPMAAYPYPWPPSEDMPVPPDAIGAPVAEPVAPPDRPGWRDRAGRDTTTLDIFASRLRLDPGGTDQLGDTTLGGRARVGLAPGLFATGEYQRNGFDEANGRFDLRQVRAGLGTRLLVARGWPSVWGTVEYTDWRLRDRFTNAFNTPQKVVEDVRGPGLHVGTRIPLGPVAGLYGEGGYVWMRDGTYTVRGPEWLGGFDVIPLASRFGSLRLFAEYRYSDMNLDFRNPGTAQARGVPANNDLKLGDFRAGARIGLGR